MVGWADQPCGGEKKKTLDVCASLKPHKHQHSDSFSHNPLCVSASFANVDNVKQKLNLKLVESSYNSFHKVSRCHKYSKTSPHIYI